VIVPFAGTRGTWSTPGPVKLPSALNPFERAKCVAVGVAAVFPPVSWTRYVRRYSQPVPGLVIGSTVAVSPSIATTAPLLVGVEGEVGEEPPQAVAPVIVPRMSAHTRRYEAMARQATYHNTRMSMGKRNRARQPAMW